MNHNILMTLCNTFQLGTLLGSPKRVHGGLLHTMWQVNTDEASYAIKQLSSHIDLTNEDIIKNYDLTEEIASRFFDVGISAVSAIKQANKYLTIVDGIGYLIYPWVDAKPLHKDKVSESHALKIAEILAHMHRINLHVPEIVAPEFDVHSNDRLLELIRRALNYKCSFATTLKELQNDIIAMNTAYQNTFHLLKNQIVVSHGDLDQKNVLWDKHNNPFLIDWESARKVNPTYEIINAALDWSGITTNFHKELFIKILHSYRTSGGHLDNSFLPAAFNAVLGNWINWMVYNIERACTKVESEQKSLGVEQVAQVLGTMIRLKTVIPNLIALQNE